MACLMDGRERCEIGLFFCAVYLDSLVESVHRRERCAIRRSESELKTGSFAWPFILRKLKAPR
jgi:hypothetical protein